MRLYLDEDMSAACLVQVLRQAGHDVQIPADTGLKGKSDAVQLRHAIQGGRVLLSQNAADFEDLHNLLADARGHHPGIWVVRRDNDPKRDLKPAGIVKAVAKLLAAGVPVADEFYVLNHWR